VTLTNSGVLYGDASLGNVLVNTADGEVEIAAGERMRFGGSENTNAGNINNFGGIIRFAQSLINAADGEIKNFDGSLVVGGTANNQTNGFIGGKGQFITDGG